MARKSGSSGEKTALAVHEAAVKLIARHGYAAVSMRQIAREVGVQVGALYLYTPDKQTLLLDVLRSGVVAMLKSVEGALEELPDDPKIQLEAFVRFHITYYISIRDEVFISFMELRSLDAENYQIIKEMRRDYERFLGDILEAGVEKGVFQIKDLRITTMAIIAMMTGVTTWFKDTGRLDPDEIVDHYLDLVFRMCSVKL